MMSVRYNSLILMGEDRGLPEPSLDDGSTAELSSLKSTYERGLKTIPCGVEDEDYVLHSACPTSGQWSPSRRMRR